MVFWNNARGAIRAPAIQAMPHPVRRRTMIEIQAFVRGGPPPAVDVITARAVAMAASEGWWMVALPIGLFVYGIVLAIALWPTGAFLVFPGLLVMSLLGWVVPAARAADRFLARTDPAGRS